MRRCIGFDFDGVLHEHASYTQRDGKVDFSLITEGFQRGFAAAVITANIPDRVGWSLRKAGFSVVVDNDMRYPAWSGGSGGRHVLVTNRKISAFRYVDDRAISYRFGEPTQYVWEEVDQAEGYAYCPAGRHWGAFGAAGVVPCTLLEGQAWVLLGKRSSLVSQPNTWGGFGGAREEGERAWDAALRELKEEAGICLPSNFKSSGKYVYRCPHCPWTYVTYLVLLEPDSPFLTKASPDVGSAWETTEYRWVDPDSMGVPLHPGMVKAWPSLQAKLERVVASAQLVLELSDLPRHGRCLGNYPCPLQL